MRIVITINTSWNIYNFRAGLIRKLLSEGHEVHAVAPLDEYSVKLQEMGCTYHPISMENTGINPINELKLFLSLKKAYRRINPDIILQYTVKPNIYGSLAAKSLSIPVINNVSGLGTVFLDKTVSSRIAKWLYQIAFRNVDLVFFQNNDDQYDFMKELGMHYLKTDLLPGSGINLSHYSVHKKTPTEKFVFLMIARVIVEKGVFEYVEAARQLKLKYPQAEFCLLGGIDEDHKRGISKAMVSKWVNEGIINYLGSSQDVRKEITNADCIVLPSYREGTPRTLLEAGAMAKPIVTTDVPGCREVVDDGENGYLCTVKDSKDLSNKMDKVLNLETAALQKMGEKGRNLIEHKFDENVVIKKYLKQISNIMNQNRL